MRSPRLPFRTLCLASIFSSTLAATGGTFDAGGNTLVSAMMMFLGNDESVYILDKAEANAAQVLGHPAWGSVWDIKTRKAVVMDIKTNSFCASGMHLPNGSYVTFGGNDAVTTNGAAGSQKNADGTGAWDSLYQDFDGRKAIRIVSPCTINDSLNSGPCAWFDDSTQLSMIRQRWYSAAEATGEGEVVIIGGLVRGGFVNRWVPNVDPVTESGQADPTYEYYPPRSGDPATFDFLVKTSGLNAYVHTYLMPSGKMLVQANLSTTLWDHTANIETPLPPMPNNVVRVYPASGATAMLPLTVANKYTPTLLFCGGSDMPEADYGDYAGPYTDVWTYSASKDCQRLTPEPTDGSAVAYEQDDDMLEGRTMGQFIHLPNGKVLVINGGQKGLAGYALGTKTTPNVADMPFGVSLATDPVFTPAIYDPTAAKGSRWSNAGFGGSKIPRLYHSTAILLPDGSIFIAGSNPNPDVNLTSFYVTEYESDIFYPSYFDAPVRPAPIGVPKTLSYGGQPFDITIPANSYQGLANDAADATTVFIIRSGFTTHAMNMGQRSMELATSYTVNKNGTITLHVAQPPPNPNLFQPGPALLFVNIKGIPSNGTYLIIGNGQIGTQPTSAASVLPASTRLDNVSSSSGSSSGGGSSSGTNSSTDEGEKKMSTGMLIGIIAGGAALVAVLAALIGICVVRRRRAAARAAGPSFAIEPAGLQPMAVSAGAGAWGSAAADTAVFTPLHKAGDDAWDSSTANLNAPFGAPYGGGYGGYKDDVSSMGTRASSAYDRPYDPYAQHPMPIHSESYGYGSAANMKEYR